jgi:hypothetical protein
VATPSEPEDRWTSSRGSVEVTLLAPRVVLFVFRGHLDPPLGKHIAASMQRHARALPDPLTLFIDAETLSGYDPPVRTDMTNAILGERERFEIVQVLALSRLVRMGVAVANLALGGLLRAHGKRADFERALRSSLGDPRPRGSAARG